MPSLTLARGASPKFSRMLDRIMSCHVVSCLVNVASVACYYSPRPTYISSKINALGFLDLLALVPWALSNIFVGSLCRQMLNSEVLNHGATEERSENARMVL